MNALPAFDYGLGHDPEADLWDTPALVETDPAAPRDIVILLERLPKARHLLDKLVRKAHRYGNPDISYSIGEPFSTSETRKRWDGKLVTTPGPDRVVLTIAGAAPQVGPYEFVAKVEHDEAGNILDVVPGRSVNYRFRTTASNCEHCKTRRQRNETFVLRHTETGEEVQVGRTCLKDFLGYESPAGLTQKFAFFRELEELSEESWGGYGRYNDQVHVPEALALALAAVRVFGWCSKGQAQSDESLTSTAEIVGTVVHPPKRDKWNGYIFERNDKVRDAFRETDAGEAAVIRAWAVDGGAGKGE